MNDLLKDYRRYIASNKAYEIDNGKELIFSTFYPKKAHITYLKTDFPVIERPVYSKDCLLLMKWLNYYQFDKVLFCGDQRELVKVISNFYENGFKNISVIKYAKNNKKYTNREESYYGILIER